MMIAIARERRHAVARADALRGECARQESRLFGERGIAGTDDPAAMPTRHDFDIGKHARGMIDDAIDRQRPILHHPVERWHCGAHHQSSPTGRIAVLKDQSLLGRSEEHTSVLPVPNAHLVCLLLLENTTLLFYHP